MAAFYDSRGCEVGNINVCVLAQSSVNICNLGRQLPHMCYNQDLRFDNIWVNSQSRANCEGSCLTGAILALRNKIMEHAVDWLSD